MMSRAHGRGQRQMEWSASPALHDTRFRVSSTAAHSTSLETGGIGHGLSFTGAAHKRPLVAENSVGPAVGDGRLASRVGAGRPGRRGLCGSGK
jgi:hypothetical protein